MVPQDSRSTEQFVAKAEWNYCTLKNEVEIQADFKIITPGPFYTTAYQVD